MHNSFFLTFETTKSKIIFLFYNLFEFSMILLESDNIDYFMVTLA